MSLSDEIKSLDPTGGKRSGVGDWYDQQTAAVREAFDGYVERALGSHNPLYKPLYDLCIQHGLSVGPKAFREWIHTRWESARGSSS